METEKIINQKVDNLIIHLCSNIELSLDHPNPIDESATAKMVSALAELLKVRKSFDSNKFVQELRSEISKEIDSEYF